MPRNGSGQQINTYSWEDDRDAGIKIRADRHKAQDDDFALGLTNSLAKDGQTVPTANLPMGAFKHTGVGDATVRTQYLSAGQFQDAGLIYVTASGTDTYAVTPSPAITAYAVGQRFWVKFTNANTTAATLNISGLGAGALTKNGTTALSAGDIPAGSIAPVICTAATPTFQIGSPVPMAQVTFSFTGLTTTQISGLITAQISTDGSKVKISMQSTAGGFLDGGTKTSQYTPVIGTEYNADHTTASWTHNITGITSPQIGQKIKLNCFGSYQPFLLGTINGQTNFLLDPGFSGELTYSGAAWGWN